MAGVREPVRAGRLTRASITFRELDSLSSCGVVWGRVDTNVPRENAGLSLSPDESRVDNDPCDRSSEYEP